MYGAGEGESSEYGIEAIPMAAGTRSTKQQASGVTAIALKALGKGVDAFRTASWVRRHDVVIVPGMGVLEATPSGAAVGVSVHNVLALRIRENSSGRKLRWSAWGQTAMNQRLTRWLFNSAARLAFYRSYRDIRSRDAMRQRGLDTTQDHVYPDLVFGIPAPPYDPGDAQTVGVGVMAYYGTNDDRRQADEIYASYVEKMKFFVRWLVDSGRRVRLFVGDTNGSDDSVVQEILADLRAHRPDLDPSWVVAEPVSSFAELMRAMAPVGTVVATRYHNVMCALRLCQAYHFDRLLREERRPDGGYGAVRVLPVRPLAGRRPVDRAVHGAGESFSAAAANDGGAQHGERAASRRPVR